jgi:hypothetical protein
VRFQSFPTVKGAVPGSQVASGGSVLRKTSLSTEKESQPRHHCPGSVASYYLRRWSLFFFRHPNPQEPTMKIFLLAIASAILFSSSAMANPIWTEMLIGKAVAGPHVQLTYEAAGTARSSFEVPTFGTSHSPWTANGTTSADTGSGARTLNVMQMCDCHVPVGKTLTYSVGTGYLLSTDVWIPGAMPATGTCVAECAAADISGTGGVTTLDAAMATGGTVALDGGNGQMREVGEPGGTISTGGVPASAGVVSSGGESATGGVTSIDAPLSTGGEIATGGWTSINTVISTAGSTISTGGVTLTGGATLTGGIPLTGDTISTGGVAITGSSISTGGTSVSGAPIDSSSQSKGGSCSIARHGRPTSLVILSFLGGIAILGLRRRRS